MSGCQLTFNQLFWPFLFGIFAHPPSELPGRFCGPPAPATESSRPELFALVVISFVYTVLLWFRKLLGDPSGPGWGAELGAVGLLPNHTPDPGHKSRHLCVYIWGLGVATPEAREGNEAMGQVPAHQGPPGVRLG